MKPAELIYLLLLIGLLVLLAGYFGGKQFQTLRGLRRQPDLSDEDRRYMRRQGIRRLVCCGLMLLLAGLLVGTLFIEPAYQEMSQRVEQGQQDAADKDFFRFFMAYWIAILFVVFSLIALAGFDFWAIARFGMRHRRQLQASHRAILHQEIARLRRQRNGESEA